jgi:FAD/FMN-containing dehydrogenase
MATITGITGNQTLIGTKDYEEMRYQYATSSYKTESRMYPALIIQPQNKNDIALALKYAKSQQIAVAIRTGGHQCSGTSSTGGPNIQPDLEMTFRGDDDRVFFQSGEKAFCSHERQLEPGRI